MEVVTLSLTEFTLARQECEPQSASMNGNTATLLIREDQTVVVPMEARIARIESDVGHIKATLAAHAESMKELRGDMKAANESIAGLKVGLGELKGEMGKLRAELTGEMGELRAELTGEMGELRAELKGEIGELRAEVKGDIGELRAEVKGDIGVLREEVKSQFHSLETKMIKWVIGTVLASGGVVFSIGRFLL